MTTAVTNMVVSNRLYYRRALADFIKKSTTLPVTVLPYMPAKGQMQSPMITVNSGPTERERATPRMYENSFAFSVRMIVLYASASEVNWLPEHAEDMLDALERELSVALLLADMQSKANKWTSVTRQGRSIFENLLEDGKQFIVESIPVVMEVGDAETE